jgi:uncharacterized paraquat-inducible protein A
MKTTNIGFTFDLICALIYIITVPSLLLIIFGPAITKGIQQIQDQRDGNVKPKNKSNRWRSFFNRLPGKKNKCLRCEYVNEPQEDYCLKCGTRLHVN